LENIATLHFSFSEGASLTVVHVDRSKHAKSSFARESPDHFQEPPIPCLPVDDVCIAIASAFVTRDVVLKARDDLFNLVRGDLVALPKMLDIVFVLEKLEDG
jgi:hypothetical protein